VATNALGLASLVVLLGAGCASEYSPALEPLDLPELGAGREQPGLTFRVGSASVALIESGRPGAAPPKRLVVDLPSALAVSGARSVEVRLAEAKTDEARQGIYSAAFSFVPTLEPGIAARAHRDLLQQTTGQFLNVTKQYEFGGIGGSADWAPGSAIFAGLAASRRTDAAQAATDTARAETAYSVASAYYGLVRARALVRIATEALEEARELFHNEDAREKRGAGIRADVLRAQAEVAQKELVLTQAESEVAIASARLTAILELDPGVELIPADDSPLLVQLISDDVTLAQLLAQAGAARPELRESASLIEAAQRDHEGTKWGPLVPSVVGGFATGQLGATFGQGEPSNDVGVSVGWKIGPGGLFDIPAINAAAARVRQSRLHEEGLRVEISRQVVEARARSISAVREVAAARNGVTFAQEGLRLSKERYLKGAGIELEVLDAQRVLTRSQSDEVDAIVHFDQAQYGLLRAIGEPIGPAR
jgi:outer membrane protein TolC